MKKILCSLLLLPVFASAQKMEVIAGGGFSTNSKPSNNMYYKGNRNTYNYAATLKVLYNLDNNVQIGLDAIVNELSRRSDLAYVGFRGEDLVGGDDKKLVFSKVTTSVCAVLNKKLVFGSSNIYGGVGGGFVIGRNNSSQYADDESYKAPDGGFGLAVTAQVGYNYNISSRWALNVQAAMRYYELNYNAEAPVVQPSTYLNYRVLAYPVTAGLAYKFGYNKKLSQLGETELVN